MAVALPKSLTSVVSVTSSAGMKELAKDCKNSAERFRDTTKLLDGAEKAFTSNDFEEGMRLVAHSIDRLNKKD